MAGGKRGGRYVAGIWLAYTATIAICGHIVNVFPQLGSTAVLTLLAVGFGSCYGIAVIGALRGRKALNAGKTTDG